jgi:two-component system, chemotaxis family, sensor kinase CheA
MNALLEQFLSESRDFLQGIGEKLMQLEDEPNNTEFMVELFRFVHTLKGNSGLFDFPEMTRVLHASEDLMDSVRNGHVAYSQKLADQLLEAMDFVGMLIDEIESTGEISNQYVDTSASLAKELRALIVKIPDVEGSDAISILLESSELETSAVTSEFELPALQLPEEISVDLYRKSCEGTPVVFLRYQPDSESFFKGEDPLFQVRQVQEIAWRSIKNNNNSPLEEMDAYSCQLVFDMITTVDVAELRELFRYMPEEVHFEVMPVHYFVKPVGEFQEDTLYSDFKIQALALIEARDTPNLVNRIDTLLTLSSPELWQSSALRWLKIVIEIEPNNIALQQALIESLTTGQMSNVETVEMAVAEIVTQTNPHEDEQVFAPENHVPHEAQSAVTLSDADKGRLHAIINTQREVLNLPNNANAQLLAGRLKAVAMVLRGCALSLHKNEAAAQLDQALTEALELSHSAPLLAWLEIYAEDFDAFLDSSQQITAKNEGVKNAISEDTTQITQEQHVVTALTGESAASIEDEKEKPIALKTVPSETVLPETQTAATEASKFNRRAEDTSSAAASKTLKVDQEKIDRLMNLIGEMVVAKNALPYLANRAETVFGVRELAREIKAQYAVINRVAEEMQDTIMQVRMMPVSFIFQRFPRMVRDISRKLGKEVNLVLEGETTEADKNIIEALADPLIHIVRNSLDHGLETPDVRKASGKSAEGKLLIRASQESDRVLIEIIDDGKGIDPEIIKNKAYEKGLIDETTLERISDQEAVNLVFAAGFSTADVISDLSGRGVGMDVVRSAVEKVNGTVGIESEVGKGTRLFLSLPLSMAVTNVMIIESNKQIFGVPMDMVVETVRVPITQIRTIKQKQTTVLRGRIVPLLSLNDLLAQDIKQVANDDDEFAALIVRVHGENVGILVDDFRETVDIILKPMAGILGGLSGYSGAALLGDGSVLMVLNPRELI